MRKWRSQIFQLTGGCTRGRTFFQFGCSLDFGGQPESCQVADQGGNCAGVGGWGYEGVFSMGFPWVRVGIVDFLLRWERMLFVRLLRTMSRLVVMTGALFEDCCQRHLERSEIRGKKMLWEAKRFVLG